MGGGVVACGQSRDENAVDFSDATVSLVLSEFRTEDVPIGVWCVLRTGDHAKLVPVTRGVSEIPIERGGLHVIAGRPWLRWGDDERHFIGPLEGCAPAQALPLEAPSTNWSSVAPWYANRHEEALSIGAPGEESLLVEPERVTDVRWHPSANAFLYTRRLPDVEDTIPAPSDLFYLDVPDDGTAPKPVLLDTQVRSPEWSVTGDWLLYTRYEPPRLAAWHRTSDQIVYLDGYSDRNLYGYEESPTGGVLHVWFGAEDFLVDLPALHIHFNLADGSTTEFDTADDLTSTRWLAPHAWFYGTHRDDAGTELYDWTDPSDVVQHTLPAQLLMASPRRGDAVAGTFESTAGLRLVSGLPSEADLVQELPSSYFGEFSPDGRYWASLVGEVDGPGQPTSDPFFQVTEVAPDGRTTTLFDARDLSFRNDVFWPTTDSLVVLAYDRNAQTAHVRICERTHDGAWRTIDASQPGPQWTAPRIVAVKPGSAE